MQLKYIVATIASMAVSSAIAGPVAEPAVNEVSPASPLLLRRSEAAELGAKGVEYNKKLHNLYGHKLLKAWKTNFEHKPTQPRPSISELLDLKEKSKQSRATNLQTKDKRWSYSWRSEWHSRYRLGCQLYYPFSTYGYIFDWDLYSYYTCFDVYPNCEDVYDPDDCDDGYVC